MENNIKKWYMSEHASDTMGAEIDETATFEGLFETLDRYRDVYEYIGVGDSIIRELVFVKLSEIMGVDYDYTYEQWLKGARA